MTSQLKTGSANTLTAKNEYASMNRRKKGNQILKARAKKANAKLAPQTKPKYISKAERAKLTAEPSQEN